MSAGQQTPGDRACRYSAGAESVMYAYAAEEMSDLAWGLQMLAEETAAALNLAIEGDSMDALENSTLLCCKANAIVSAIAHGADNNLLSAAEALMEAAKLMLDAEIQRRSSAKAVQP